ncbi:MAG: cupin domain-containing protein [Acidimicrobiales bacterium]|nr:cupin domain-containing protein [Acidimicrobiales bacterium]
MTPPHDEGGDPPCWAHLVGGDETADAIGPVVVDLGAAASGAGGAVWSLPHGGDLDANLVRLAPGGEIARHVNADVDVLVFVQSGTGELTIDDDVHPLRGDVLALVPRGAHRSITAGPRGLTYLSIHRRRSPLGIQQRRSDQPG